MRTWRVSFYRGQFAWRCLIEFTFAPRGTFAHQTHTVSGLAGWWPVAYLRARRAARKYAAERGRLAPGG